ncbi:MAG: hypothetical protein C4293_00535 [Nitrospiraceae bacterium]
MILTSPIFWFGLLVVGVVLLIVVNKIGLLNNTVVAVAVSAMIALAYFHLVNHYLMDMQGLDYWYLFRK